MGTTSYVSRSQFFQSIHFEQTHSVLSAYIMTIQPIHLANCPIPLFNIPPVHDEFYYSYKIGNHVLRMRDRLQMESNPPRISVNLKQLKLKIIHQYP